MGYNSSPAFIPNNTKISGTEPRLLMEETDQSTDEKLWDLDIQTKLLQWRTRNGADSSGVPFFEVNRGTGTAINATTWYKTNGQFITLDGTSIRFRYGGNDSFEVLSAIARPPTDNFTSLGQPAKRWKEIACALEQYATAQVDKTDTNLADFTGLSVALVAAGIYSFSAVLLCNAPAGGGAKVAMSASGGLTATAIRYNAAYMTAAAVAVGTSTALGTAAGGVTAANILITIDGYINVNVAGTMTVQVAQNAASGTTNFFLGSYLNVKRIG